MHRNVWAAGAAVLCLTALPSLALGAGLDPTTPAPVQSQSIAAMAAVPTLKAVTVDGKPLDITAQPGWKVVFFWSGACPCVRACEHWTFKPLSKKYTGKVSFFGIVSGRFDLDQPPAKLKTQIAADNLGFPVLLDPKHEVVTALGAEVTPETFLLDPQNRVVFSGMPDDSRRYQTRTAGQGTPQTFLASALAEALAGKPITRPHIENEGCIIAW